MESHLVSLQSGMYAYYM